MEKSPIRIIQISDLHIFADKEQSLLGVKTYESFSKVIELLKQDKTSPDLILLSGDLSQDDSQESYFYISEILKDFPVPVYYIPGNHDNKSRMEKIFPLENITNSKQIILNNWQLILLNSQKPGKVEGYLDPSQLDFLQDCLNKYPEHHAIVVFHHQPIPVGSTWLDNLGIKNADELWGILGKFPKMHTILFGHVHQEFQGQKNGINYYSPPSTCIQFKSKSVDFALDNLPPGYRLIELYPDGKLKTKVYRCSHYVGVFDSKALGY